MLRERRSSGMVVQGGSCRIDLIVTRYSVQKSTIVVFGARASEGKGTARIGCM